MGENIDEAKGRVKEAAGDLTDDQELKNEGKVDKAVSDVKEKLDDVGDKVKDAVGKDRDPDAPATGTAPRAPTTLRKDEGPGFRPALRVPAVPTGSYSM